MRAFESEAHQIHTEERRGAIAWPTRRPDLLVADRHTVFVDPVLDAPEPGGPGADETKRSSVGDVEVLGPERAAGRARPERLDHLRFAGRAIGVLGEDQTRWANDTERIAHAIRGRSR